MRAQGETVIRVRYNECDPMGVAHHSSCIGWFEIGRTELLREAGVTYAQLEHAGVFLVVTRIEVNYKRPARYDDELVLVTRITGGGRARIDHDYELWRGGPGPDSPAPTPGTPDRPQKIELLATAVSTLACVDAAGRPQALPDWLRWESAER